MSVFPLTAYCKPLSLIDRQRGEVLRALFTIVIEWFLAFGVYRRWFRISPSLTLHVSARVLFLNEDDHNRAPPVLGVSLRLALGP